MGLKINFTQSEAESKAREVPPTGAYLCNITEVETKEVKPGSDNQGKPYWNFRFTIQEGKYQDNNLFGNIMLFSTEKSGTLSSLAQLLKALGYTITEGEFDLPEDEEVLGRSLVVVGRKLLAGFDNKARRDLPDRFKITGYKQADGTTLKSGSNSSSSMLP